MDQKPQNQPQGDIQPIQADQAPVQAQSTPPSDPQAIQLPPEAPQPKVEPEPPKQKKDSGVLSLFVTIIVAIALVQIINVFFLQSYRVYGSSMHSTLDTDDRLIISKFGKTFANLTGQDYEPKRGDIVVFTSPKDENIQLIKRVIGLPGERVVVKSGEITVYNQANPEGFNPDENTQYEDDLPRTSGNVDIKVPSEHIFVSGDNRTGSNSLDSRNELGTVSEDNIIGTLRVRIWPLDQARFF